MTREHLATSSSESTGADRPGAEPVAAT